MQLFLTRQCTLYCNEHVVDIHQISLISLKAWVELRHSWHCLWHRFVVTHWRENSPLFINRVWVGCGMQVLEWLNEDTFIRAFHLGKKFSHLQEIIHENPPTFSIFCFVFAQLQDMLHTQILLLPLGVLFEKNIHLWIRICDLRLLNMATSHKHFWK